jgi:hypothetical protein
MDSAGTTIEDMARRNGFTPKMQAHRLLLAAILLDEADDAPSDETCRLIADYFQVPTPEEYARGVPFPRRRPAAS